MYDYFSLTDKFVKYCLVDTCKYIMCQLFMLLIYVMPVSMEFTSLIFLINTLLLFTILGSKIVLNPFIMKFICTITYLQINKKISIFLGGGGLDGYR